MIRVLVNVNARGALQRPDLPRRLRAVLGRHGDVVETRSPADLDRAVDACRRDNVAVAALCGGDGTNARVLTAIAGRYAVDPFPAIAFLPGGTVNTVARNFGIVGAPEEVLLRLLRRVDTGSLDACIVPAKTLRINGDLGFLFGAGLAGRFYQAYYEGGGTGLPKAARLTARVVGGAMLGRPFARHVLEPIPCEVVVDGERLPVERYSLLVAGTVPSAGLGLRILPRCNEDPLTFQFVATGETLRRLAVQIGRVWRGSPLIGPTSHDRLARSLLLRFPEPAPCVVDGEMILERTVRIVLGPTFRLACP